MEEIRPIKLKEPEYNYPKGNILGYVFGIVIILVVLSIPFSFALQLNYNRLGRKYIKVGNECLNQAQALRDRGEHGSEFLCNCGRENSKIPFRWDMRLAEKLVIFNRKEFQQNMFETRKMILESQEKFCKMYWEDLKEEK